MHNKMHRKISTACYVKCKFGTGLKYRKINDVLHTEVLDCLILTLAAVYVSTFLQERDWKSADSRFPNNYMTSIFTS